MSPRFSITAVSSLVGVPVETLRNWERRYAFLKPGRSDGGKRYYTPQTVELLRQMVLLMGQGMRIGDLADLLSKGLPLPSVEPANDFELDSGSVKKLDELYDAILAMNLGTCNELFDYFEDHLSAIERIECVYDEMLKRLGKDWELGKVSVAQEHFGSGCIRRMLHYQLHRRGWFSRLPVNKAICTTLSGEEHEGGILMIANHFKMRGWAVYEFGTQMPYEELAKAVARVTPDLVCLSFTNSKLLERNLAALEELRALVFVGGSGVVSLDCSDWLRDNVCVIKSRGKRGVDEVLTAWQSRNIEIDEREAK